MLSCKDRSNLEEAVAQTAPSWVEEPLLPNKYQMLSHESILASPQVVPNLLQATLVEKVLLEEEVSKKENVFLSNKGEI
jgi:hypothetical protein